MTLPLIAVLVAYLTGTIPFGLLIARSKGIDIRQEGSGNIGATNVGRVLGARWGLFVLLLDAVKGGVPTAVYPALLFHGDDPGKLHLQVGCGLAAIVGHMFPCWLRFRGGKGVATALGVVIVLSPLPTLIAFGVFAVTFAVWRIVSLSSMMAAAAFLISAIGTLWPSPFSTETWSLASFSVAVPLLIIVRHRSNLARLIRGKEPRYRSARKEATVTEEAEADLLQEP